MYKKLLLGISVFSMLAIGGFVKADVQDISFKYCDVQEGTLERTITVTPEEEKELCIEFFNGSDKQAKVVYSLSTANVRESGIQVCGHDNETGNNFNQFFTPTGERSTVLEKGKSQTIKEKIKVPVGMSGFVYGCIIFQLGEFEQSSVG